MLESEGNYTRICFGEDRPLVRRSLKYLDEQLDPKVFFRTNRRQIVNLRKVVEVEPDGAGGIIALVEGGIRVELSRRRAQRFQEILGL